MQEILLTQEDYVSALIDIGHSFDPSFFLKLIKLIVLGFLSHSSEDYLNPMNSPTSIYEIIQENKNSFDVCDFSFFVDFFLSSSFIRLFLF